MRHAWAPSARRRARHHAVGGRRQGVRACIGLSAHQKQLVRLVTGSSPKCAAEFEPLRNPLFMSVTKLTHSLRELRPSPDLTPSRLTQKQSESRRTAE